MGTQGMYICVCDVYMRMCMCECVYVCMGVWVYACMLCYVMLFMLCYLCCVM